MCQKQISTSNPNICLCFSLSLSSLQPKKWLLSGFVVLGFQSLPQKHKFFNFSHLGFVIFVLLPLSLTCDTQLITMTLNAITALDTENSCKIKFAIRFLRALSKMKKPSRSADCLQSMNEIHKRSRTIKLAAYSSMAHAIGTRRAWSRAILIKLGIKRTRNHVLMKKKRSSLGKKQRVVKKFTGTPIELVSQEKKLRKLVPGVKSLDICSLLEETAHYVKCLTTQVKVMQTIADHNSK